MRRHALEAKEAELKKRGHAIVDKAQVEGRIALNPFEERRWDLIFEDLQATWRELEQLDSEPIAASQPSVPMPVRPSPAQLAVFLTQPIGDQLRAVAYHEAGHAVAWFVEGGRIANVILRWGRSPVDGRSLEFVGGRCEPYDSSPSSSAIVNLGGQAATDLAGLSWALRPGWHHQDGCTKDNRSAAEWCERRGESAVHYRRRYLEDARALLQNNWPAVQALAWALMTHGEVRGREAERIIVENLPAPSRRRLERVA